MWGEIVKSTLLPVEKRSNSKDAKTTTKINKGKTGADKAALKA